MKNKSFLQLIFITLCINVVSCKKDSPTTSNNIPNNNNSVVIPELGNITIDTLQQYKASFWSSVTSDGGGNIIERGVCYNTSPHPTKSINPTSDGTGIGNFSSSIYNLAPVTTYFVRSYASNSAGTGYSNELTFTTPANPIVFTLGSGVSDIDGNFYHSIIIGGQEWFAENLKTTRFCNGDIIAKLDLDSLWLSANSGGWCFYLNDSSNDSLYGKMYNRYTIIDSRNICPCNWHVPTMAEWIQLEDFLGGYSVAGGKMKIPGLAYWDSPNPGADNSSGFSAYPSNFRRNFETPTTTNTFGYPGSSGDFWSTTATGNQFWFFNLSSQQIYSIHQIAQSNNVGMGVRCIKD